MAWSTRWTSTLGILEICAEESKATSSKVLLYICGILSVEICWPDRTSSRPGWHVKFTLSFQKMNCQHSSITFLSTHTVRYTRTKSPVRFCRRPALRRFWTDSILTDGFVALVEVCLIGLQSHLIYAYGFLTAETHKTHARDPKWTLGTHYWCAHMVPQGVNNPRALRILSHYILKRAARCILAEGEYF
jgi:hypothetical protein